MISLRKCVHYEIYNGITFQPIFAEHLSRVSNFIDKMKGQALSNMCYLYGGKTLNLYSGNTWFVSRPS
jgi:hypothetical protein